MALVSINWNPSPRELKKFGFTVIIGLGLLGLLFHLWLDRFNIAICMYTAGLVLGIPGLTGTKIAMPGYLLWMGIAFVIGSIVSRIILTVVYYGLFTPMGLVMRLTGRDKLRLHGRNSNTYWQDLSLPDDKKRYERQF